MIFQVGDHQPYQPLMMFFAHLRLRTDPAPYYLKPLKTAHLPHSLGYYYLHLVAAGGEQTNAFERRRYR